MDPLYDDFVPIFLVSVWSDKTRTRIGRRMPFILATLPLSALLFAALVVFMEPSMYSSSEHAGR